LAYGFTNTMVTWNVSGYNDTQTHTHTREEEKVDRKNHGSHPYRGYGVRLRTWPFGRKGTRRYAPKRFCRPTDRPFPGSFIHSTSYVPVR
jgi:hypothetical protein